MKDNMSGHMYYNGHIDEIKNVHEENEYYYEWIEMPTQKAIKYKLYLQTHDPEFYDTKCMLLDKDLNSLYNKRIKESKRKIPLAFYFHNKKIKNKSKNEEEYKRYWTFS